MFCAMKSAIATAALDSVLVSCSTTLGKSCPLAPQCKARSQRCLRTPDKSQIALLRSEPTERCSGDTGLGAAIVCPALP